MHDPKFLRVSRAHARQLIANGLMAEYDGLLVPRASGGAPAPGEDEPLFAEVPEDLATVDDVALQALIDDYTETIADVTTNPAAYVSAGMKADALIEAAQAAVAALRSLKAEQAARTNQTIELSEADKEALAALGVEQTDPEAAPAPEPVAQVVDPPAPEPEPVVAAVVTPPRRGPLPAPSGTHVVEETEPSESQASVALVAAGGARDILPGTTFGSELELAEALIRRHDSFGPGGPDVVETYTIAKAEWKDQYGERRLRGKDEEANLDIIKPVINPLEIRRAFRDRVHEQFKDGALVASALRDDSEFAFVASGGLCAPVTPYYGLQYISVPVRPVMGSLPSFQADRGGLRYARPAALSAVTTAVGIITEAEDHAGGSLSDKTCQVIACPPFQETDVDTIYHCLQFGNLGARVFPELVAQWTNLVIAAHARLAESNLLTSIDAFCTQVTAGALGLGASATLFSQILAAANGLRNRNRMDPNAILRLMMPWWGVDLIVSDVIRTQFQRFDTDQAKVTALLRSCGIEPTFYIDGANGRGQVFATQNDGPLLPFPEDIVWYLFPEGSFIYLDSGMLELGIVRDSVLNKTNDFQVFGETWEQVAFVGVEALAVETEICDSGTVSLPAAVTCPIDYSHGS